MTSQTIPAGQRFDPRQSRGHMIATFPHSQAYQMWMKRTEEEKKRKEEKKKKVSAKKQEEHARKETERKELNQKSFDRWKTEKEQQLKAAEEKER